LDGIVKRLDEEGGHNPDHDRDANRVTVSRTSSTVLLRGQFCGVNAERLEELLAVLVDRVRAQIRTDMTNGVLDEMPTAPVLRAMALDLALGIAVDSDDKGDNSPNSQ